MASRLYLNNEYYINVMLYNECYKGFFFHVMSLNILVFKIKITH